MGNCESDSILLDTQMPVLGRMGAVAELKMINCIWEKDYQGLYDFDSKEIRKQLFTFTQDSLLLAVAGRKSIRPTTPADYKPEVLRNAAFEVTRRQNYYKIVPIYIESEQFTVQKLLWLVVRSVPAHRYALREKDILKFGKQKVKVREIVHNDPNNCPIDFNVISTSKKVYEDLRLKGSGEAGVVEGKEEAVNEVQSVATENEPTCRICLEGGELSNPLLCACKCTGSVRYIHLQCLRTWLGKQLNVSRSRYCLSIRWVPLSCEMCKSAYRYRIYLDNRKYYTVEIPKPSRPYVVLEVLRRAPDNSKVFHFVSLADNTTVSIGRRKDIDVKISDDVSVSRHHANLIYDLEGRRFLLEDNRAKFGTLVLVKRNLLVNPMQRGLTLQMAGELFVFETHRQEGSIPDYHDEQQYLNVPQNGDQDEDSEDNNDDEEFDQEEAAPEQPTHQQLSLDSSFLQSGSNANTMPMLNPPTYNALLPNTLPAVLEQGDSLEIHQLQAVRVTSPLRPSVLPSGLDS